MLVKVMIQVQQGITSPVCTRTSDAFVILTSLSEAPLQCCGLIMRRLLWWTGKALFWTESKCFNHIFIRIGRNLAFVGGIDLAYQRWDDEKHRVVDEEGIIYPG